MPKSVVLRDLAPARAILRGAFFFFPADFLSGRFAPRLEETFFFPAARFGFFAPARFRPVVLLLLVRLAIGVAPSSSVASVRRGETLTAADFNLKQQNQQNGQ